jgi:hypothetical protein
MRAVAVERAPAHLPHLPHREAPERCQDGTHHAASRFELHVAQFLPWTWRHSGIRSGLLSNHAVSRRPASAAASCPTWRGASALGKWHQWRPVEGLLIDLTRMCSQRLLLRGSVFCLPSLTLCRELPRSNFSKSSPAIGSSLAVVVRPTVGRRSQSYW